MSKKKEKNEHIYTLHLTKRHVQLLSYACDRFSRLICGQDWTFQELMEEAWEKRCKEAVGGHGMDNEWDGGWYAMRHEAEEICKKIKKRFWNLESNAMYGVYYDKTADILFDLHQTLRHQLWIDRPEGEKSHVTVDASEATRFGEEPLAEIERTDNPTPSMLRKDMAALYADIDNCIKDLVNARAKNDDTAIASVHHKMESLMVSMQQELQVLSDYFNK